MPCVIPLAWLEAFPAATIGEASGKSAGKAGGMGEWSDLAGDHWVRPYKFKYIESWGQTFGTPDFDIWVLPCQPPGPKSQGLKKQKFITPIDPPGVVTSGFPVKNYTGFCYRGIFIIDKMGSYVPNTLVPVQTSSGSYRFRFIPVPVHMDYGFQFRFWFKGFLHNELSSTALNNFYYFSLFFCVVAPQKKLPCFEKPEPI